MSSHRRVDAGSRASLMPDHVRVVDLPVALGERPREALVVIDDKGEPRAFLNRCKHLPIPIDAGSRRFLDPQGNLVCGTHGAIYRRRDGVCIAGPCVGEALDSLDLELEGDRLYVLDAR